MNSDSSLSLLFLLLLLHQMHIGMMIGNWKPYWIELWMRNAAHLPKQPVMMFLDPGEGARKPDNEGKLPTENRQDPPEPFLLWQMPNLLEHYIENAPHVQSMKEAVWNLDANPRYNFNALVSMNGRPSLTVDHRMLMTLLRCIQDVSQSVSQLLVRLVLMIFLTLHVYISQHGTGWTG